MSLIKVALGYVATAYVNDAVLRPQQVGALARTYCDRVRKPLLLIQGAGLSRTLLGPPVRAELQSQRAYPLRCPTKALGAVFAVGTLERLQRPDLALAEWRRVADKVFVVVPSWWSPHAWLDPDNRWMIDGNLRSARPLWTSKRQVYLLPVSDSRYGKRPWAPNRQNPRSSQQQPMSTTISEMATTMTESQTSMPSPPQLQPLPSLPAPASATSSAPSVPEMSETPVQAEDLFDSEETGPFEPASPPFDLSSYPQVLTVVSELPFDES